MISVDKKGNITITRGDTGYLVVPITVNVNGTESAYVIKPEDRLYLTVKTEDRLNSDEYLVRKEIVGDNHITILPSDTKSLEFGSYVYDVELDTTAGEVFTVITKRNFIVAEEVS